MWLFLKQHMVALAVCEMLCRQKYSWGVTNHTPLLFIIAADMSSAGPSSLALGLGTPVAWLHSVCPPLNLKAGLLLQDGL